MDLIHGIDPGNLPPRTYRFVEWLSDRNRSVSLERLTRAMQKSERLCVGVLSGTSVDAAEAALCRIQGSGATVRLELLSHVSLPFEPALMERVVRAQTIPELSTLNFELG